MKRLLRGPVLARLSSKAPIFWLEAFLGIAIAFVAVASTLLLQPVLHGNAPFALMFVAVTLATVFGGWRCGVWALAAGHVAIWWAVVDVRWSFVPQDDAALAVLVAGFVAEATALFILAMFQKEASRAWAARDDSDRSRDLLIAELNHRVKNTLAVVQSMARQSFVSGGGIVAVEAFEGRLGNLAGSHDLLTNNRWENASMAELVDLCLAGFRRDDCVIAVSGPTLDLSPQRAVNLSLGLHELATNALKYGALSVAGGRVEVTWSSPAENAFTLTWEESGGPPVVQPGRRGFGTRMITRGVAAALGGEVDFTFAPTGVICTIRAVNG